MHIALIGATGTVGRHILEQALDAGHRVTALVRDPARLDVTHADLDVVAGDVTRPDAAGRAVQGADAVVVALGAGRAGGIREAGTRRVVEAMRQQGVDRLICLSTIGAGDSRGNLDLFWKYLMFGLLLRKAYADHQRQEQVVRASGLNWTIVRPGAYTDGPRTGEYRHGFGTDAAGLTLKISRADVADLVLRQLSDERYVGRAVSQSY